MIVSSCTKLNSYNWDGSVCSKCGYRAKKLHSAVYGAIPTKYHKKNEWVGNPDKIISREYLIRTCPNCKYSWNEACVDSE